ncbi:Pentatricopeptide repeat-containing protein [Dissostichus eleginoides]|uniref:Pentatricopeptide repeat-containing protein n=1 Tax=Dissostichus eleginoides TaxID=100907 RepID=A0AAD9EYK9_DISEL|nr:Pentatricopeptide repeat-containing protein [Dissostichus eleginoides]
MASVRNILQYLFPGLVGSIAVVLLCFYMQAKKKRAAYDVTVPTPHDDNRLFTISLSEDQAEEETQYDRFPPRYSTMDLPPPYSLFDPKITSIWSDDSPPAYEMFPITPSPHHWMTPAGHLHP